MEVAELDSKLAIARNNPTATTITTTITTTQAASDNDDDETNNDENKVEQLTRVRKELIQRLDDAQCDLQNLLVGRKKPTGGGGGNASGNTSKDILERIVQWSTNDDDDNNNNNKNAAPYRGAIGFPPMRDSKQDSMAKPYLSPYDLLKEIIQDQLNADVIGCVLENTSLLNGNLVLGGAIVLQRNTPSKETQIAGETVRYQDYDEDFGSPGVRGGDIMIVECDVDEVIAVALTYDLPLQVESSIFDNAAVAVEALDKTMEGTKLSTKRLPQWRPVDSEWVLQVEGDADNRATGTTPLPISIPRTTSSLFDSIFESKPSRGTSSQSSSMFPTDNPIKSLDQLDGLSNSEKAKLLLEMSNFSGKLPRPRALWNAPQNENPMDNLLLPLIDESVRNQYRIRDALRRGDLDLAAQLDASKSKLQKAKEMAEAARNEGDEELASQWDEEARLLETLRADVTQDEGSYSRFLDRDEWYERDRQRTAKRTNRSSFGNLLDGIE
jgi:hypothetical protein